MLSEEAEERKLAARLQKSYPLNLTSDKPTGLHSKQPKAAVIFNGKICAKCGGEDRYLRSRGCRGCNILKLKKRAQDAKNSPEVRKIDSPEVRKIDSPEVRKIDSPEVRKIDSFDFPPLTDTKEKSEVQKLLAKLNSNPCYKSLTTEKRVLAYTYTGNACKICGTTERYIISKSCKKCLQVKSKLKNERHKARTASMNKKIKGIGECVL